MVSTVDRLDRYWAEELGCTPEALHRGGLTVCDPPHRSEPRWMGWLVPFECIALVDAEPGTGVVSIAPTISPSLRRFTEEQSLSPADYIPPRGGALLSYLDHHLPQHYPKLHRVLRCEADTFQPAPAVLPISELASDDLHADWYRMHFDGPVFVARNERGSIVSWAAIKCKSDTVWEMAVVTEPPYRCRGLARSVVSHATRAALASGKQPMYMHDVNNHASARVANSLGYHTYAYELTVETGRVPPPRKTA